MSERPYAIPIPYRDPVEAFQGFAGDPVAALLDSAAKAGGRGRYAYIAADPFQIMSATSDDGNPFAALDQALKLFRLRNDPALPPFQGGAVGFLGYEMGRYLENLPAEKAAGLDLPDMCFGLYDTVCAFDTRTRQAWVVACNVSDGRPGAEMRAQKMAEKIAAQPPLPDLDWTLSGVWTAELSRDVYQGMVKRALGYIHAGDIFQANITQRLLADLPSGLDHFMLYRRLRSLSPAPFGAYLGVGPGAAIASASPERFLSLDQSGHVTTRPIKGTRPRGQTPDEDDRLARDLVSSEKDMAENLMIVDLLRNDLSRVCRLGSVGVSELARLESFANVHHLVSEVHGTLFPNVNAVDLLRATFPGGSITGAPKIRAMEIINELEPARRGAYCGAVAWIGFDGAMDSSIIIRTLAIKDGVVAAQAGGGIVADSDPAAEYDEAMDKVWPLLQSLDPSDQVPVEKKEQGR